MIKTLFQGVLCAFVGLLTISFIVAFMCFIAWDTPDNLMANSWLFRILLLPAVGISGGVAYNLIYG